MPSLWTCSCCSSSSSCASCSASESARSRSPSCSSSSCGCPEIARPRWRCPPWRAPRRGPGRSPGTGRAAPSLRVLASIQNLKGIPYRPPTKVASGAGLCGL
ncbi:MAG: hypothetical protein DMF50_12570 [Acidobacteria bacterium]|nr:MAG: hypothetical protein DMF50_12570 [Acidobacteriota bacterium]